MVEKGKKVCPKCGEEKNSRGFATHVLHCKVDNEDEEDNDTLNEFLNNDKGYEGDVSDLKGKKRGLNKVDLYKEYEKMKNTIDKKTTAKDDEEDNECGKCGKHFKDIVKYCPFCGVEFDV